MSVMGEIEILQEVAKELRLDLWWKDLLGQDVQNFADLDFDVAEKTLPVSETHAAKMVKKKLDGVFTFIESRKTWYLWDGIIHNPCDGTNTIDRVIGDYFTEQYNKAIEMINEAKNRKAEAMKRTVGDLGGSETGDEKAEKFIKSIEKKFGKAIKFEERLGTNSGTLAIVKRLEVEFSVGKNYYEDDRRWFVFKNAVLDLDHLKATGEFTWHAHDPKRNVTKYFDAEYSGKNLGHWDGFLERSIPDCEARMFLQKVIGAAFMGITKSRMIVNLFGPPASGKSTIIDAIQKLGKQGIGYCIALDKHAIVRSDNQTNFGQNDFKGRRFISVSEPDHRAPADDDFLKSVSGDETMMTRGLYGQFEEWTPQGILFIASNAPLRINTRDTAIVERLHLISFPNSFKEESPDNPGLERVKGLEEMLYADRDRILEWIFQGMHMYMNDGMQWNAPQSVIQFRGEVVAHASVAVRWLEDMRAEGYLAVDMHNERNDIALSVPDAFKRFKEWKQANNERSNLSKNFFAEDIANQYTPTKRVRGVAYFPYIVKTDKYLKEYDVPLFIPPEQTGNGNQAF